MAGFHRKLLAVRPFASKRLLKMGTNRWLVRGTRARRGPFTLPQVTGNILAFCAGVNDFLPGAASPTVRYGISSSLDERRSIERTTAKNTLGTVAHPIYCTSFMAALPPFSLPQAAATGCRNVRRLACSGEHRTVRRIHVPRSLSFAFDPRAAAFCRVPPLTSLCCYPKLLVCLYRERCDCCDEDVRSQGSRG